MIGDFAFRPFSQNTPATFYQIWKSHIVLNEQIEFPIFSPFKYINQSKVSSNWYYPFCFMDFSAYKNYPNSIFTIPLGAIYLLIHVLLKFGPLVFQN